MDKPTVGMIPTTAIDEPAQANGSDRRHSPNREITVPAQPSTRSAKSA